MKEYFTSMHKENIKKALTTIKIVLLYGGLTGILTGLILYLFKFLAGTSVEFMLESYKFVAQNPAYIPLLILGLLFCAGMVTFFVTYETNAGGGAIARTAGFVRGLLTFAWLKTLISTFISALFVFLGGLPFGIEGPSVVIGTSVAGGINDLVDIERSTRKYVLTSGASAGFSIATGSVMAGAIFPLEEMHKKFSLSLLLVALSGATFATATVRLLNTLFNKPHELFFPVDQLIVNIPFELSWIALIIGIVSGLLAVLFNYLVEKCGHLSDHYLKKVPLFVKFAVNFLIVGVFGLMMIESLGNGHESIINHLFGREIKLGLLVALFFIKLFLIILSNTSGVTGGLFVPVLVIGALYAGIVNEIAIMAGLDATYTATIVLIGMTTFFATSMQAPITTLAFVVEASLHPELSLMLVASILMGMMVGSLLKLNPLNEITLKKLMKRQDKDRHYTAYEITATVKQGCFVMGKAVREVLWPANCMVKEMIQLTSTNHTNTMVHGGDRVFELNDRIVFWYQTHDITESLEEIKSLLGNQDITYVKS